MGTKIVIGDRNTLYSNELANKLESETNFRVIATTDNGETLIRDIELHKPNLVIMDLDLVSIDGFAVLQRIYRNKEKPKIIAVTSFKSRSLVSDIMDLGVSYFIYKPCKLSTIVEKAKHLFWTEPREFRKPSIYNPSKTTEIEVAEVLYELAVSPHLLGYKYLREAIVLVIENYEIIHSKTKVLYPTIAQKFNSTPSKVERAMRNAIAITWDKTNAEILGNYFPSSISNSEKRPACGEFIATIAESLKLTNLNLRAWR